MFIIKHNGNRFGKKSFATYEEARSYARKLIRKYLALLNSRGRMDDFGGTVYRNPSINMYGYSIQSN